VLSVGLAALLGARAAAAADASDAGARTDNPLANMAAPSLQDDYIGRITDTDEDGNPAISFGPGPQITASTAPDEWLGSEKWSAGLANVLFDGRSKRFRYGYLLTWQAGFAGSDDRADVNVGALQPSAF
jgi:hypothetical protein